MSGLFRGGLRRITLIVATVFPSRLSRCNLGRVIRDIARKIEGNGALEAAFAKLLALVRRVRDQQQHQRGPKVYSLHAPEVECIGKGKAHRPYELMAWTTPALSGNVKPRQEKEHEPCPIRTLSRSVST